MTPDDLELYCGGPRGCGRADCGARFDPKFAHWRETATRADEGMN